MKSLVLAVQARISEKVLISHLGADSEAQQLAVVSLVALHLAAQVFLNSLGAVLASVPFDELSTCFPSGLILT